uniref:Basic proline-rich protein-like n=1 Tax=Knipowitschia caucasica TaxID=637954 RepID=A0AAV2LFH3_KNICA
MANATRAARVAPGVAGAGECYVGRKSAVCRRKISPRHPGVGLKPAPTPACRRVAARQPCPVAPAVSVAQGGYSSPGRPHLTVVQSPGRSPDPRPHVGPPGPPAPCQAFPGWVRSNTGPAWPPPPAWCAHSSKAQRLKPPAPQAPGLPGVAAYHPDRAHLPRRPVRLPALVQKPFIVRQWQPRPAQLTAPAAPPNSRPPGDRPCPPKPRQCPTVQTGRRPWPLPTQFLLRRGTFECPPPLRPLGMACLKLSGLSGPTARVTDDGLPARPVPIPPVCASRGAVPPRVVTVRHAAPEGYSAPEPPRESGALGSAGDRCFANPTKKPTAAPPNALFSASSATGLTYFPPAACHPACRTLPADPS